MSVVNINDALGKYTLDAGARGYSQGTIIYMEGSVRAFCRFVGRDDLATFSSEDLQRFIVSLRKKKAWSETPHAKDRALSGSTINTYVRGVRAFWSWMLSKKMIDANPMATVPAPKIPRTLPKVFNEEELRKIYEVVSKEPLNKAMFLVLLDSGIRLAGLVGLKLGSIDLNRGRIRVIEKGNKERLAYFSPFTAAALKEYLPVREKTGYGGRELWVSEAGIVLSSTRVQKILEQIGQRAKLTSRLSAHKLRHTYATQTLKYKFNMEYLKKTLGHADIETTSNSYLNVADEDIALAYQSASPVFHLFNSEVVPIDKPLTEPKTESGSGVEYKETAHKKKVRELALELVGNIRVPSLDDEALWQALPLDFNPGEYSLPVAMLEVDKQRRLKIKYKDPRDSISTLYLLSSLDEHLATSSPKFTELTGAKGKIGKWMLEAEGYLGMSLKFLQIIAHRVKSYDTLVDYNDENMPGIKRRFPLTIWADAISVASGFKWVEDSWYHIIQATSNGKMYQLMCGASMVAVSDSQEKLKDYEIWHRDLKNAYAGDGLAKQINNESKDLTALTEDITQLLQEFSDNERLTGVCSLERPD